MMALGNVMVFLSYTPRADAEMLGYVAWLRQVDNPFFNSQPGVMHYSNWKVANIATSSFSHFDLMYLNLGLADQIWTDKRLVDFAAAWTKQWGRAPQSSDLSINYHSYRLEKVRGIDQFDPGGIRVASIAAPVPTIGGVVWRVSEEMVGASPLPFYEFAWGGATSDDTLGGIVGTLIAAPGIV